MCPPPLSHTPTALSSVPHPVSSGLVSVKADGIPREPNPSFPIQLPNFLNISSTFVGEVAFALLSFSPLYPHRLLHSYSPLSSLPPPPQAIPCALVLLLIFSRTVPNVASPPEAILWFVCNSSHVLMRPSCYLFNCAHPCPPAPGIFQRQARKHSNQKMNCSRSFSNCDELSRRYQVTSCRNFRSLLKIAFGGFVKHGPYLLGFLPRQRLQ